MSTVVVSVDPIDTSVYATEDMRRIVWRQLFGEAPVPPADRWEWWPGMAGSLAENPWCLREGPLDLPVVPLHVNFGYLVGWSRLFELRPDRWTVPALAIDLATELVLRDPSLTVRGRRA